MGKVWAKAVCCNQYQFHVNLLFHGQLEIRCAYCEKAWGEEWRAGAAGEQAKSKPTEAVGNGGDQPENMVSSYQGVLSEEIDSLQLSIRARNALVRPWGEGDAPILRIGDLVKKKEGELLRLVGFGRKSLSEVKELLAKKGLYLRGQSGDTAAGDIGGGS